MSKLTIETLVRKVSAELDKGDQTPTAIQHVTKLGFKDIDRAINFLKSQGRIENRGEALHLRPAPAESSIDPASRLQDTLGAALTTLADTGVQLVLSEPAEVPAPVIPEPVAPAEPQGFMRPCEACGGAGSISNANHYIVPCGTCDGTGIHTEPDPEPPAPVPTLTTIRTLAANPVRRAELRADDRLQALIAARRAEWPDAFMAAPTFKFGIPNAQGGAAGDRHWHNDGLMLARAWRGLQWHIDLWVDGAAATGHGETVRAAYAATWRERRLDRHDKAELLRTIQHQHELLHELAIDVVQSAFALIAQADVSRTQRRRALLTARARGMERNGLRKETASPGSRNEQLVAENRQLKTALVEKITAHWDDEHVVRYLAVVWPLLTPERQTYLAPGILNEIACGQMNSAWTTIVKKFAEVHA